MSLRSGCGLTSMRHNRLYGRRRTGRRLWLLSSDYSRTCNRGPPEAESKPVLVQPSERPPEATAKPVLVPNERSVPEVDKTDVRPNDRPSKPTSEASPPSRYFPARSSQPPKPSYRHSPSRPLDGFE